MSFWMNKTAVLTGAGSGFGKECALIGAKAGMNLVLADVQADALQATVNECLQLGAKVLAKTLDVSKAEQVEQLAQETFALFGAPHLVFNNAGVGAGGLVWENSLADWQWVLGVNLMGVVHGVKSFTPMMLAEANNNPNYQAQIINTASMAGLLNAPNMGIYNVSKHAVVSLSESLYQDLALVSYQVSASVLCPYFVPTGISQSHRNRPADLANSQKPTQSQLIGQAMSDEAVSSGKVTAAEVAQKVLEGARSICAEAGITLAGGHSIDCPEPVFGLAVNGIVDIKNLKQNSTATAGCKLYLTKNLGVGILTTAQKKGILKAEHADIAPKSMSKLNKIGEVIGKLNYVKAMTDVTGFGLLGHLSEMCEGSNLQAVIEFNKVPKLKVIDEYLDQKSIPGGTNRNWASYGHKIGEITERQKHILADPQTSGGLLVAVEPEFAQEFETLLKENGIADENCICFGELKEKVEGKWIEVI